MTEAVQDMPARDDGEGYDELVGEEVEPDHELDVASFEEDEEGWR
jgi:hypothetical protein